MISGYITVVTLSTVAALCGVGVFNHLYRDTLLERIGMSLICIWSISRVLDRLSSDMQTDPIHLILHVGMFVFAIGMASAKYRSRHVIRSGVRALT